MSEGSEQVIRTVCGSDDDVYDHSSAVKLHYGPFTAETQKRRRISSAVKMEIRSVTAETLKRTTATAETNHCHR